MASIVMLAASRTGGMKIGAPRRDSTPPGLQHIEQVRNALVRWNSGTPTIIPEEVHPELELWTVFSAVSGEPYRGMEGLKQWLADIAENFERWEVAFDAFHAAGDDTVVALVTVQLQARESGVEMTQPFAWIVDFTDDQFRMIRSFTDHGEALRAAGLSS
jgi:ketosteroid isomerase-like protein